MMRKTLTILSLIGLLLSLGLWGVSEWVVVFYDLGNGAHIRCSQGSIIGMFTAANDISRPIDSPPTGWALYFYDDPWVSRLPSTYSTSPIGATWTTRVVELPLWIVILLFTMTLGLMNYGTIRRRKRKKLGLCVKCGYDLRASKDICPECGTEFEATDP